MLILLTLLSALSFLLLSWLSAGVISAITLACVSVISLICVTCCPGYINLPPLVSPVSFMFLNLLLLPCVLLLLDVLNCFCLLLIVCLFFFLTRKSHDVIVCRRREVKCLKIRIRQMFHTGRLNIFTD